MEYFLYLYQITAMFPLFMWKCVNEDKYKLKLFAIVSNKKVDCIKPMENYRCIYCN